MLETYVSCIKKNTDMTQVLCSVLNCLYLGRYEKVGNFMHGFAGWCRRHGIGIREK